MTKETVQEYSRRITQASPTGLVVITYELIDRHLADAEQYSRQWTGTGDETAAVQYGESIRKARNLLGELISSLKLEYPVSGELLRIYLYLNRELQLAAIRKDATLLPRLRGIVQKLGTAFAEVEKTDDSGPVMEHTQRVYAGMTYSKNSLNEDLVGDFNRGFKV